MKPRSFDYVAPDTRDEALDLLAEHGDDACVLAGGQSLTALLNQRLVAPKVLIDIMRIGELDVIRSVHGSREIGAGVRMTRAMRDSGVPLLVRAIAFVGYPAIRNAGTVCGSVAHAGPAAEIPAVLVALGGEVVLESRRQRRGVAASQFFQGHFATAREPDELIVAVRIPARSNQRVVFMEVTPRPGGGEAPTIAVAATADQGPDGRPTRATIALAGAAERPVSVALAEAVLAGEQPAGDAITSLSREIDPPTSLHAGPGHRRRLIDALVKRALRELLS
jgi:CO/xanthine dehydrogenase FAD-binding subunit